MSRLPTWTFGVQPSQDQPLDALVVAIATTYGGTIRQFEGQDLPELTGHGWAVKFDDATDDPFGGCAFLVDVLAVDVATAHGIAVEMMALLGAVGWTCILDDEEFDNPPLPRQGQ